MRAAVALLLAVAPLALACSRAPQQPQAESARLQELRRVHAALHDSLEGLVAGDTLLAQAAADTGEVVVALRAALVEDLILEVTRRYFDHVELDISPRDLEVREQGELRIKALFARIKAGEWRLRLTVHRIQATLRAQPPRVSVAQTNRIHLQVPVVLEKGRGTVTIRFTWDASTAASVVCRDFQMNQRLTGVVIPQEYEFDGDFVLTAGPQSVVARPEFPQAKLRLRVDMTPESWTKVQGVLGSQDKIFKCGIPLNPPKVVQKLRDLGRKGFNVKLPQSIFRTIEVPAAVSESVTVEDHRVDLSVRPNTLRVTPRTFWYSAAVQTGIQKAPADTALAMPGR